MQTDWIELYWWVESLLLDMFLDRVIAYHLINLLLFIVPLPYYLLFFTLMFRFLQLVWFQILFLNFGTLMLSYLIVILISLLSQLHQLILHYTLSHYVSQHFKLCSHPLPRFNRIILIYLLLALLYLSQYSVGQYCIDFSLPDMHYLFLIDLMRWVIFFEGLS